MKEGDLIKVFFSRISNIINKIRSFKDTFEDKKIIEKNLKSLTVKYDHVVAAKEEPKNLSKLTLIDLVISRLMKAECQDSQTRI